MKKVISIVAIGDGKVKTFLGSNDVDAVIREFLEDALLTRELDVSTHFYPNEREMASGVALLENKELLVGIGNHELVSSITAEKLQNAQNGTYEALFNILIDDLPLELLLSSEFINAIKSKRRPIIEVHYKLIEEQPN